MVDNKIKTKSAMLQELESIKGLLLEEDDIPILQEVIAHQKSLAAEIEEEERAARVIVEQQQDFFDAETPAAPIIDNSPQNFSNANHTKRNPGWGNPAQSNQHGQTSRTSLAKATGENPFLPQHIRSRLHGNNPPPLFAQETARKIAQSSKPMTMLGSMKMTSSNRKSQQLQDDIIDSIIEKLMPEIELELRLRLQSLSDEMLEELQK